MSLSPKFLKYRDALRFVESHSYHQADGSAKLRVIVYEILPRLANLNVWRDASVLYDDTISPPADGPGR